MSEQESQQAMATTQESDDDSFAEFAMADTSPDISKHDSSSDSEAWARFTRYDSDADTDTDSAPENDAMSVIPTLPVPCDQENAHLLRMECSQDDTHDDDENDDDGYLEFANLESDLIGEMEKSKRKRRPTFIESSEAEWDEYRHVLLDLYETGWEMINTEKAFEGRIGNRSVGCRHCQSDNIDITDTYVYIVNYGEVMVPTIQCLACGAKDKAVDMMVYGLFPLSTKKSVFVQFELIRLLSLLTKFNPLLSHISVVNALNFNSLTRSMDYVMRPEVFNAAMREWRRLEDLSQLKSHDPFNCPACGDTPHCVHIDGNAKLYRYEKAGGVTETEYDSKLILNQQTVQQEVDQMRKEPVQEAENVCGDVTFKAAKSGGQKHKYKDETGLMLATCRHMFVLKALDMKRGEIFEYPYILQKQFPSARYIAHDTICKYWPWLQKLDGIMAENQTPILSVMHAKSHVWNCQVRWSAKVVPGAGRSTGETTELVNSYLSRLGPVTRNSTKSNRQEKLESSCAFWNTRKLLELPTWISSSLKKRRKEVEELELLLEKTAKGIQKDEGYLKQLSVSLTEIGAGANNKMEKNIEQYACRYQRLSRKITTEADSSKSRKVSRDAASKAKKQLDEEIDKYVKASGGKVTKKSTVMSSKTLVFPWSRGPNPDDFNPDTLAAVEVLQLLERTSEEVEILKEERTNLIKFIILKSRSESDTTHQAWITKELLSLADKMYHDDEDEILYFEEPINESDHEGDDC